MGAVQLHPAVPGLSLPLPDSAGGAAQHPVPGLEAVHGALVNYLCSAL